MHFLQFLLPLCGKPKYLRRMEDFQRYGIVNHENERIGIKALIGIEPVTTFTRGWGDWDQEIEFVPGFYDHVAQKIYSYYAALTDEDVDAAQWFIRVDDDSSTNAGALCEWLRQFDPNEPHYFTTKLCWEKPPFYIEPLAALGYGHLTPKNGKSKRALRGTMIPHVPHEWECSIVSQAMMRKIIRHDAAMNYLYQISQINTGWGDMGLSLAARIVGNCPSEVEVLSAEPDVLNYSAIGGDIHHIHFVAHDLKYWGHFTREMQAAGF